MLFGMFFFFFPDQAFPIDLSLLEKYQSQMLGKLKSLRTGITITGDGQHDSMGHSAKFGAYTILCCTVPMIIHFSLVQAKIQFFIHHFYPYSDKLLSLYTDSLLWFKSRNCGLIYGIYDKFMPVKETG